MKFKDYLDEEKPYEKLLKKGANALSDVELLAIILKTGTKDENVLEIARSILTKDKKDIGLHILTQYSIEELMKIRGIGRAKAILINAVLEISNRLNINVPKPQDKINTPDKLARVFMIDLHDKNTEIVETAILDSKNRVLKVVVNSIGSINSNYISIKDILSEPLKSGAPKIAVAHNHPSGDTTPSSEDIVFTRRLQDACKLIGIELLDHIIIGGNNFSSFKSSNLF